MSATKRRRLALVGALVIAVVAVAPTAAWAAPEGRIQNVISEPGLVKYVFSAEGIAEGETIDPASVTATIDGQDAPTTATPITNTDDQAVTRTVMLVLDTSGSMADFGKLEIAKSAANAYLTGLPADVRSGLVTFSDVASVDVAPTVDRAAVTNAISALQAGGGTALNDAVILTVGELGTEGSRSAVLLSDGNDADSEASGKQARSALSQSGVVLDAVSLGEGSQEKSLAAFAKAGNGTVVTATDATALTAAFESAARTVATQLAVTSQVPDGVVAGTVELSVAGLVGDQAISDSAAALITEPGAAPSPSEDFGAVAVADTNPGIVDQPWFLLAVVGAVFIALATITSIAVGAIDSKNRKEGRVSRRLEEVSAIGPPTSGAVTQDQMATALGESAVIRRTVSFADRVAASRNTTNLARKLEEASVALRPGEWAVVHGLIAVLAAALTTLLTNFNVLLAIVAFGLGLLLPWLYLDYRAGRRRAKFYSALPDAMQMLAGSLTAGYSLPQALDNVARDSGGTFGEEINRALLESRLGLPLEEALEAVAQRMQSKDFHWVVMAIRINRRVGGNLAEVLTNVGKTLRERERLRRQVKTLSAEGVLSAWIIGALPFVIGLFVAWRNPGYLQPLVTTVVGWVMIVLGLVLYVIGIIWMRNLVKMEV